MPPRFIMTKQDATQDTIQNNDIDVISFHGGIVFSSDYLDYQRLAMHVTIRKKDGTVRRYNRLSVWSFCSLLWAIKRTEGNDDNEQVDTLRREFIDVKTVNGFGDGVY